MLSKSFGRKRIALGFAPIIVIGILFGLYVNYSISSTTNNNQSGSTLAVSSAALPSFELQGFSLCASDCVYPSPYLSGMIEFLSNGNTNLKPLSLQYSVNGTTPSTVSLTFPSNVPAEANWSIWWKSGADGAKIISGDSYLITFTITYNGIDETNSLVLRAGCSGCNSTFN
jgi:hypothetical protein